MPITTYPMTKAHAAPVVLTDLSWQAAASQALADIWFGAVPLVDAEERRVDWLTAIEDSLPTLDDVDSVTELMAQKDKGQLNMWAADEIADLRSCFEFIGAITVVNSQLMFADVLDTVIGKQRDYGHGNILKFGLMGLVVRLSDKIERLKNLQHRGACIVAEDGFTVLKAADPVNESIEDSKLDIIGYSSIALLLLDGTFTRELV